MWSGPRDPLPPSRLAGGRGSDGVGGRVDEGWGRVRWRGREGVMEAERVRG